MKPLTDVWIIWGPTPGMVLCGFLFWSLPVPPVPGGRLFHVLAPVVCWFVAVCMTIGNLLLMRRLRRGDFS